VKGQVNIIFSWEVWIFENLSRGTFKEGGIRAGYASINEMDQGGGQGRWSTVIQKLSIVPPMMVVHSGALRRLVVPPGDPYDWIVTLDHIAIVTLDHIPPGWVVHCDPLMKMYHLDGWCIVIQSVWTSVPGGGAFALYVIQNENKMDHFGSNLIYMIQIHAFSGDL
jgi:hypothetical protein